MELVSLQVANIKRAAAPPLGGNFDALNSKVISISSINPFRIDGLVKRTSDGELDAGTLMGGCYPPSPPLPPSTHHPHPTPPLHIKGPPMRRLSEASEPPAEHEKRASHTESIRVTHAYFHPAERVTDTWNGAVPFSQCWGITFLCHLTTYISVYISVQLPNSLTILMTSDQQWPNISVMISFFMLAWFSCALAGFSVLLHKQKLDTNLMLLIGSPFLKFGVLPSTSVGRSTVGSQQLNTFL